MPWHESVVRAREVLDGRLYLLHPVMQRILRLCEGFKDMLILDMASIRWGHCMCVYMRYMRTCVGITYGWMYNMYACIQVCVCVCVCVNCTCTCVLHVHVSMLLLPSTRSQIQRCHGPGALPHYCPTGCREDRGEAHAEVILGPDCIQ